MNNGMKVIIPVAGAGTRLQPHTLTLPKALLPVGDRPVLAHVLAPLVALEPEEVVFVIGHKGSQIMDYVRDNYSFKTRFVPQEKLLGLGYALHLAMKDLDDGPALIILGDTVVDCDCDKFLGAGDYVLGLRQVENPHRFGIAEVRDNYVVGLEEKPEDPKTNLALIGLYYFADTGLLKKELANLVRTGHTTSGEIQLTDALHAMIEAGIKFAPYEVEGWFDCGKKETLLSSNRELLKRLPDPKPVDGSVIVPPVYIAPDARIDGSIIGPNVSVLAGAAIEGSVVRNSIISEEAFVRHAVLDHSLIGRKATVTGKAQVLNIGDASHANGD